MDPLRHCPQDLLVPNRRCDLKITVDDANYRRLGKRNLIEVSLPHRLAPLNRRIGRPVFRRQ